MQYAPSINQDIITKIQYQLTTDEFPLSARLISLDQHLNFADVASDLSVESANGNRFVLDRINTYLHTVKNELRTPDEIATELFLKKINYSTTPYELPLYSQFLFSNIQQQILTLTDFNNISRFTFNELSSSVNAIIRASYFPSDLESVPYQYGKSAISCALVEQNTETDSVTGEEVVKSNLISESIVKLQKFYRKLLNYGEYTLHNKYDDFELVFSNKSNFSFSNSYTVLKEKDNSLLTYSGVHSSIINCYDIIYMLNLFLSRLKHIKRCHINHVHLENQSITAIKVNGKYTSTDYIYTTFAARGVSLLVSALMNKKDDAYNTATIISNIDSLENSDTAGKVDGETQNDDTSSTAITLDFSGLIYDYNSHAETISTQLYTFDANTNGTFAHWLTVKSDDTFKLTIAEVQKKFNIYPNEVISLASIYQAIDYIFSIWYHTMSTLDYYITTCHLNCHSNTYSIETRLSTDVKSSSEKQQTQKAEMSIYQTQSCGCTKRHDSATFSNKLGSYDTAALVKTSSYIKNLFPEINELDESSDYSIQYIWKSIKIQGLWASFNYARCPASIRVTVKRGASPILNTEITPPFNANSVFLNKSFGDIASTANDYNVPLTVELDTNDDISNYKEKKDYYHCLGFNVYVTYAIRYNQTTHIEE